MKIIVSANNNEEVLVLPVVPPSIELTNPQNNETFQAMDGEINLIGTQGLSTLSISSFFPVNKNYTWVANGSIPNGWNYVDFFNKWKNRRVPIRVIMISKNGRTILNKPYAIKGFTYVLDKAGDIIYTLELKEYVFVS